MTTWYPIHTAPTDPNREVDLWIIPPSDVPDCTPYRNKIGKAHRATNCARSMGGSSWTDRDWKFVTGKWFFKDDEEWLDPDDVSPQAWRATHWSEPTEPPADEVEQIAKNLIGPPVMTRDDFEMILSALLYTLNNDPCVGTEFNTVIPKVRRALSWGEIGEAGNP